MKQGHIDKSNNIDENCFVSPAVITVKKVKSVKIALDSRKLNEITIKRKPQMHNMEELISRISRKIADGPADEIWTSKLDLDYAYGQLSLSVTGHTDNIPRKNRPDFRKQTPSMARRYNSRNQKFKRTTQKGTNRCSNPARKRQIQTQRKQIRIF